MMHHYSVTVTYNNETVRAYPTQRDKNDTSLEECCKRIGMMVMSSGGTDITVYRDGLVYRKCTVEVAV